MTSPFTVGFGVSVYLPEVDSIKVITGKPVSFSGSIRVVITPILLMRLVSGRDMNFEVC